MPVEYQEKGALLWVAPSAIKWDEYHVTWLLRYLPDLIEGYYPAEPAETTGKSGKLACAPHETACQIAAELERRLSRIGQDRDILERLYCDNEAVPEVCRRYSKTSYEITNAVASGLSYIASGDCPRWLECFDCGEFETCKKKRRGRKAYTYPEWRRERYNDWRRN